jgi:hypothetical protein
MALTGFDVSNWQAGAYSGSGGFSFGIVKLTEGVGFKDPSADRHMAAILAQPIVPGGYHFARPDLNPGTTGAYGEADWFWRVATSYGGALGMLLIDDAESAGGSLQWCTDFAGRLAWRLGGYSAWLYSYLVWLQSRGIIGSDLLTLDPLFFAWPDANGPLPSDLSVSMQQYGLVGVPGIAGSVDANRFFGDITQLRALTLGGGSRAGGFNLDPETESRVVSEIDNLHTELGVGADGVTPGGVADLLLGRTQGILDIVEKLAQPTVDVNALATALAPHLQAVDLTQLEADIAHLPAEVQAAFAKALSQP